MNTIPRLIKKSWLPLFFTIVVFSIIAGGISMILSVEEKMATNIDKNTYRIYINQTDSKVNFTNDDLLSWLNGQVDSFVFYKNRPESASRLSYSNEKNSIYNVGTNSAYINVWNEDDQIIKKGEKYFYFDRLEYEVVGYIDHFINIIASIIPSLEANPEAPIEGEYYIDAKEKSELLIQDLLITIQKTNKGAEFNYEKIEKSWVVDLLNQQYALFIFLGSSALLFVSGFTIILSWVEKYKREMFVRRLSGAGENRLLLTIYFNMLSVRVIGIILASLFVFSFANIFNLLPYNTVFRLESIIVGIVLFFIMDIIYTLPMLFINQRKQLIKIMR